MSKFDELLKFHTKGLDRDKVRADLKEVLNACFDEASEIRQITLHGRTPSWNDGDACTHSESCAVFTSTMIYDDYMFECAQEEIECAAEDGEPFPPEDIKGLLESSLGEGGELRLPSDIDVAQLTFDSVKNDAINRVKKLLRSQELSHSLYGTNYVLSITREDGEIVISHADCWPSY